MKSASNPDKEASLRFCDRCGRRAPLLVYDELSLRDLCPECRHDLESRRIALRISGRKKP